ncbi:hypothetical protein EBESD8_52850 [Rhodococcus aetherivorans]|nr:hypothetical protein EBESD8_52850 [Rhodococcus aetherivorans]
MGTRERQELRDEPGVTRNRFSDNTCGRSLDTGRRRDVERGA